MAKTNPPRVIKEDKKVLSPHAGFIKRFAAYICDLLIVAALLLLASALAVLVVIISNQGGFLELAPYRGIGDYLANNLIFASYLAVVIIAFYSYFWCKKGQTLGMKACHLRIQNSNGSHITFTQSLIRMATSAFGLGNFCAIYQGKNAFQDLWANCEMIELTDGD